MTTARRFLASAVMATLVTLMLALAVATARVSAYSIEYRIEKLEKDAAPGRPIALDSKRFFMYTEEPRNYSIFVVLTALGPQHSCNPCKEFAPEWALVSQGWSKKGEKRRAYFGVLDFADGQEVFMKLKVNSAPFVLHFPPTEGPHRKVISGDYETYDVNRNGLAAEAVLRWLKNVAHLEVEIQRPIDYQAYGLYALSAFSFLSLAGAIYRNMQNFFSSKKLWIAISLFTIVLFCGGHMWNMIRGPPFTGVKDGRPELFAPGFQNQFVIETVITGALYATCSALFVGIAIHGPKIQDQSAQRMMIYAYVGAFLFAYSVLLRVFKFKNGGYPFTLFL
ncbi:hypothetical protein DFJ73DRAFT_807784 [Zopfochytrium polystomum]|nr:hypothetical protein DFJ73DRAFT_807784 [Zopfochytrium polystomum]